MPAKDVLVEEYIKTHPKSKELHERALKFFPASGATHISRVFEPFLPYITHAKGSRKWDVDGHEYIDYVMGHGALILGHSHPSIVKAVQEQMAKGTHYGSNHDLEVEWAELISRMVPIAERVAFTSSGQEANMMAVRLARIFTGRQKVLRLEENYHGWSDELAPVGWATGSMAELIKVLPLNDLDLLEKELGKKEYAVLLVEGGGGHMSGQVPIFKEVAQALPGLTKKYGTLLSVDEVVTGFRSAPGGWQSLVGIKPDLTTFGKCVTGGLAGGAVVGRADVFEALSPSTSPERRIRHAGTWNANPLLCAAGVAACKLYLNGEPQRKAHELADYYQREGDKKLKERNISGRLYLRDTMVHFYLGPFDYEPPDNTLPPTKDSKKIMNPANLRIYWRLTLNMFRHGIAPPRGQLVTLSAVHSKEEVDQAVQALGQSLDALIAEGTIDKSLMLK